MIFIRRLSPPPELTHSLVHSLTASYIADTTKTVWDQRFLRDALLVMTHKKCAYCEASLNEQSMYMEIDHFHPKSLYKHLVIDWVNLLPSCKHCNATKGDYDSANLPIVDPTKVDPRDHLKFALYRFHGVTERGEATVEVLGLNDQQANVYPRFRAGEMLNEAVDRLLELGSDYKAKLTVRSRNKMMNQVQSILREAGPLAEYSAVLATILRGSKVFSDMVSFLTSEGLWNNELESLLDSVYRIAYA